MIKKIFQAEGIRFALVGVANTIIGTATMLFAYNILGFGYWISSILNYVVGSVFSYFANKYFTFQAHQKSWKEIVRFVSNIVVCYIIAYSVAQPLIGMLLGRIQLSKSLFEQISMLTGTVIFIIINFCGQKFFVFKK
ncbi:MAG: GtrA family protein [Lachnospiraceae bacterium]|nr:GtrA family protein [Lachnospiraceae bacterium]